MKYPTQNKVLAGILIAFVVIFTGAMVAGVVMVNSANLSHEKKLSIMAIMGTRYNNYNMIANSLSQLLLINLNSSMADPANGGKLFANLSDVMGDPGQWLELVRQI